MNITSPLRALAACGLALTITAAAAQSASAPAPTNGMSAKDQVSYATGVTAIRNFIKNDVPFDLEKIIQGMRDAQGGKDLAMSEKDIRNAMNGLQVDLRRSMAANQKDLAEKNRKRGTEYLAAYRQKPGTSTMSNGVAYRVQAAGSGAKPIESDSIVVRYRGTSIDGVEFDSTLDGKTSTLRMNQVIMGWREALKQMPTGSRWEIVIPSQLAYGERGVGAAIGPNETLVFDVELLEIKK
jgi:FKBP-type peptidyl-prolyl cis-trans isomerase FklB